MSSPAVNAPIRYLPLGGHGRYDGKITHCRQDSRVDVSLRIGQRETVDLTNIEIVASADQARAGTCYLVEPALDIESNPVQSARATTAFVVKADHR